MFKSRAAAEKAALDGQGGEEFDTQKCLDLQQEFLSSPKSSPQSSNVQDNRVVLVASNAPEVNKIPSFHNRLAASALNTPSGRDRTNLASRSSHAHPRPRLDEVIDGLDPSKPKSAEPIAVEQYKNALPAPAPAPSSKNLKKLQRNKQGLLRLFDINGNEHPLDVTRAPPSRHVMSQMSNSSAVSATQENPQYLYAQYERPATSSDEFVETPTASDLLHDLMQPPELPDYAIAASKLQQQSAITDSTARTYAEDDTGHVDLGIFGSASLPAGTYEAEAEARAGAPDTQEAISQDASFAPETEHKGNRFSDPETPAAPVNPFTRKGSVMKGYEMFGATQPSSIGRTPLGIPSSRPSPDIFNTLQSPTGLGSSPLRRFETEANDTSPLQSSVRGLLIDRLHHSLSPEATTPAVPRTSGIQSFNVGRGLQRTASLPEPQNEYISMKESQERRKKLTSSAQQDPEDDEEEDLGMDSGPRRHLRKMEKERNIQKELSAVELNRIHKSGSGSRSSTREVEVPSTGKAVSAIGSRRCSVQEEYIAQCEGHDARDTQQTGPLHDTQDTADTQDEDEDEDGVIADSQVIPVPQEPAGSDKSSTKMLPSWDEDKLPGSSESQTLPPHKGDRVPDLDTNFGTRDPSSDDPTGSPLQQFNLPLQELSGNGSTNSIQTPRPRKLPVISDGNIPETSPPEDRIRPMRDIASMSLEGETEDDQYLDIPGFTQDPDFEHHMLDDSPECPQHSSGPAAPEPIVPEKHDGTNLTAESLLVDLPELVRKGQAELNIQKVVSSAHAASSPPDSSAPLPPGRRSRPQNTQATAKALQAAADRAEQRKRSKIAFRKRQILAGTDYELEESDEEDGVKEALESFRKELEDENAKLENITLEKALAEVAAEEKVAAEKRVMEEELALEEKKAADQRAADEKNAATEKAKSDKKAVNEKAKAVMKAAGEKAKGDKKAASEKAKIDRKAAQDKATSERANVDEIVANQEEEAGKSATSKSASKKSALPESSPDPLSHADTNNRQSPGQNADRNGKRKGRSRRSIAETPQTVGRAGLRARNELNNSSRDLRTSGESPKRSNAKILASVVRSAAIGSTTPKSSNRVSKPVSAQRGSSTRSSNRSSRFTNASETPDSSPLSSLPPSVPTPSQLRSLEPTEDELAGPTRRVGKRKSVSMLQQVEEEPMSTKAVSRATKRRFAPVVAPKTKKSNGLLFVNMVFAVSYSHEEKEKNDIMKMIEKQGGQILDDGFECLFEISNSTPTGTRSARIQSPDSDSCGLELSDMGKDAGFTALISDEHSRKAKFMQALALGLPCLSGRWVSDCVAKDTVLDWTPYLLCAGQSKFLGNAIRSRTLQSYSATDALFSQTFASRQKLLEGKSIILITGRGQAEKKRHAYIFLTRVLGPSRLMQVPDLARAREKLLEAESTGEQVHCLYAEHDEDSAKNAVFGFATAAGGSQKRKRASTAKDAGPAPKRVKVISDEFVIQSLILGQLVES